MLSQNNIKGLVNKIFFVVLFNNCFVIAAFSDVINVDNYELQILMSKGTPVIDIREKFEWQETGILPESHLITFFDSEGKYDVEKWLAKLITSFRQNDNISIKFLLSSRVENLNKRSYIYFLVDGLVQDLDSL